ncbi:MAG: type II toxin-antitoxin system death-on-curing family toxin [Ktedonobacteraceae bacterium]
MIRFVPLSIVMKIHDDVIDQFGGASGLRDAPLLDSALHMPSTQFGGEFLHTTIYEMAAAYGFHICKNHPFLDGNKRTAYAVMFLFLSLNGLDFAVNDQEHYIVMMAVANSEMTKQQLAAWLEKVTFR